MPTIGWEAADKDYAIVEVLPVDDLPLNRADTGPAQHLGSQAAPLFDCLLIAARSTFQEAGQGGFS